MNRRMFTTMALIEILGFTEVLAKSKKSKKYTFRIRTKKGNFVGGVSIYATDAENAKYKLSKRYPT